MPGRRVRARRWREAAATTRRGFPSRAAWVASSDTRPSSSASAWIGSARQAVISCWRPDDRSRIASWVACTAPRRPRAARLGPCARAAGSRAHSCARPIRSGRRSDETGGEFVERLRHPVDVTQPVPAPSILVAVAALVVEVPAGQRGRLERDPVLKPDLAGEGQHVPVDVERRGRPCQVPVRFGPTRS